MLQLENIKVLQVLLELFDYANTAIFYNWRKYTMVNEVTFQKKKKKNALKVELF